MAKRNDPLYQPHPSKAAQIAEREEHAAQLREIEERAKAAGISTGDLAVMSTREREAALGSAATATDSVEPDAPKSGTRNPAK